MPSNKFQQTTFFNENWVGHIMHTVSNAENLHEMSHPFFLEQIRKNIISLSSAELVQKADIGEIS